MRRLPIQFTNIRWNKDLKMVQSDRKVEKIGVKELDDNIKRLVENKLVGNIEEQTICF